MVQDVEDAAQAFAKQRCNDSFSFVLSTAMGKLLPTKECTKERLKGEGAEPEGAKANVDIAAQREGQNEGICGISVKADRCDARGTPALKYSSALFAQQGFLQRHGWCQVA